jgi:aminoglycoside N3'-acetyltransferase
MVPTFSMKETIYKTCLDKNYIFDPRVTGTFLGAIPSTFLKFPGVYRSVHPTHSVSAVGKHAKYITESHHLAGSISGPDSPWAD